MKVAVFGSGGHARVVAEIIMNDKNLQLLGFIDNLTKDKNEKIFGLPIKDSFPNAKGFVVGIGNNEIRAQRFNELIENNLKPITVFHPTANIAKNVTIGKGTVIAIGATIATGAKIGNNVIINTGAIVEHENIIEDNVHIGPGAALAGRVKVKKFAFLGLRSVVKEYLTIGEKSIVGAGAVVVKNVPAKTVVIGIPAKKLRDA